MNKKKENVDPKVSKYMGSLAKKSWEKSRKDKQDMKELGKKGAEKRWKDHVKKQK